MVNFGPLAAEISSVVWSTPANFNGFRVLAALLQRGRSTEANQTLHSVWLSPGLVHDIIHFRGFLPRYGILPGAKFSLRSSLAQSYFGSVTAWHSSSGRQPTFAALSTGRHLYSASAGRPSRWKLVHILVLPYFTCADGLSGPCACRQ